MKEHGEEIEQARGASEAKHEKPKKRGETAQQQIRKAKKVTRRRFSAEDKIGIVMEGMRGEEPVSVLCRRLGLQTTVYYRWLKDFMEAGKQRLRPQERAQIVKQAVAQPHLTARELAYSLCDHAGSSVAESTVYRVLRAEELLPGRPPEHQPAAREFHRKTKRPNELWQSDATRFLVPG